MSRLHTYSTYVLNRDPDNHNKVDRRVEIRHVIGSAYGISGLEFSLMPLVNVMYDPECFDNLMEKLCPAYIQS